MARSGSAVSRRANGLSRLQGAGSGKARVVGKVCERDGEHFAVKPPRG